MSAPILAGLVRPACIFYVPWQAAIANMFLVLALVILTREPLVFPLGLPFHAGLAWYAIQRDPWMVGTFTAWLRSLAPTRNLARKTGGRRFIA